MSILKVLTCKSRHKKTLSRGKLIHLASTADYSSLRLLELIPGLERRWAPPPTGPAANHRAAEGIHAGTGLSAALQQDHPMGSCFLSWFLGSGAAAADNLEPDWWRLVTIWCFWFVIAQRCSRQRPSSTGFDQTCPESDCLTNPDQAN